MRIFARTQWIGYVGACAFVLFVLLFHTPYMIPNDPVVTIRTGASFDDISEQLRAQGVITSPFLFRIAVGLVGGTDRVQAGPYRFDTRERLLVVAYRVTRADYGVEPTRVFLREGLAAHDMARILAPIIGAREAFLFEYRGTRHEGYLFPDTYFILPTTTSNELIELLTTTFDERTQTLRARAEAAGRSWEDVVNMASIVEREAQTFEDKRIVAGILWKRLDDGMRLQVDAPFAYLLDKASDEITRDDLDSDSPYNTYRFEGLPPAPISNPGLETLEATIEPIETDYWFYLSDIHGTIHYAITYDQHLNNKARYID